MDPDKLAGKNGTAVREQIRAAKADNQASGTHAISMKIIFRHLKTTVIH